MRTIIVVVMQFGREGNYQTECGKKDECFSLKLLKICHCFSFAL